MTIRKANAVAEDVRLSRGDYGIALVRCDRLDLVKRLRELAADRFGAGTQAEADVRWMASELEKEIGDAK